ncbi:hypothetical protein K402DRAFT_455983 [Aulographum hederae CBS 113979]|uniref:Uncharacterized protein n=1 Tax=Aulographum hederae CBS 113979 TaxID=1176131 RepID=A0A6G1GTX2_9PEZI|nr:hypothetical protein K402DRAFT_455983 [Aulographum hederae CBS 113979]
MSTPSSPASTTDEPSSFTLVDDIFITTIAEEEENEEAEEVVNCPSSTILDQDQDQDDDDDHSSFSIATNTEATSIRGASAPPLWLHLLKQIPQRSIVLSIFDLIDLSPVDVPAELTLPNLLQGAPWHHVTLRDIRLENTVQRGVLYSHLEKLTAAKANGQLPLLRKLTLAFLPLPVVEMDAIKAEAVRVAKVQALEDKLDETDDDDEIDALEEEIHGMRLSWEETEAVERRLLAQLEDQTTNGLIKEANASFGKALEENGVECELLVPTDTYDVHEYLAMKRMFHNSGGAANANHDGEDSAASYSTIMEGFRELGLSEHDAGGFIGAMAGKKPKKRSRNYHVSKRTPSKIGKIARDVAPIQDARAEALRSIAAAEEESAEKSLKKRKEELEEELEKLKEVLEVEKLKYNITKLTLEIEEMKNKQKSYRPSEKQEGGQPTVEDEPETDENRQEIGATSPTSNHTPNSEPRDNSTTLSDSFVTASEMPLSPMTAQWASSIGRSSSTASNSQHTLTRQQKRRQEKAERVFKKDQAKVEKMKEDAATLERVMKKF